MKQRNLVNIKDISPERKGRVNKIVFNFKKRKGPSKQYMFIALCAPTSW